MIDDILDKLLSLSTENEVVEFKEAKTQFSKDKLGKYFSAISNEANLKELSNGWLILGIKDDKTIVGTSISEKQLNEYKAEIIQFTSPRNSFTNIHRIIRNGKDILMIEIPAAPKGNPVSWKGFKYGRDGESLGSLNDVEYDKIKAQNNSFDWSAQIINNATISDLSNEAIKQAKIRYTNKNPNLKREIKQWENIVFLNKAKITIKNKITNTAILLLGKPESEHFINPATSKITWVLKNSDNIEKDYEHFSSPLLLNVEKVYAKIRNLKYRQPLKTKKG